MWVYKSAAWRTLHHAHHHPNSLRGQLRSVADSRCFAPDDLVLLRQKLDRSASPVLSRPLKAAGRIQVHKGVLLHDDIIGKRVRDVVATMPTRSGKDATKYRLHEVKLEEYVRLSRRLVTPIYPADARLIVELFDLHVEPFDANASYAEEPKLEILEAGTGHGALTLYLSRAIHAANPSPPEWMDAPEADNETLQSATRWEEWKRNRRAVLHTVEYSAKFARHAESVVKGFRHGMYHRNVDFHVTDVGAWTQKALSERDEHAFLSCAFLDLPNADKHLSVVSKALRTDGCLIVFNPSVTQILDCVRKIKEEGVLLELENVIELGVNGSSAGREWNVRMVQPRSKALGVEKNQSEDEAEVQNGEPAVETDGDCINPEHRDPTPEAQWSSICRPKVGERIVGGGFLGVWRKQRDMRSRP